MLSLAPAKFSALLSTGAALIIVLATSFQWWDVTFGGNLVMRRWARVVLVIAALALVGSLALLLVSPDTP